MPGRLESVAAQQLLVPTAEGMTFAAFEEIRRVVLILIKGSRGNDCVFFDHGFILAEGSDI
jgi:hypothetical protein